MRCQQLDHQVSAAWIKQAARLSSLADEPCWNEAQLLSACHGHDMLMAAIESENVVGYLVAAKVLDEAEIHTVLVDLGRRGRGIAKAMLDNTMVALQQQGVQQVYLEVRASNTAAQALYAGYGFKPMGERKAYYKNADGSRENAVLMQWASA